MHSEVKKEMQAKYFFYLKMHVVSCLVTIEIFYCSWRLCRKDHYEIFILFVNIPFVRKCKRKDRRYKYFVIWTESFFNIPTINGEIFFVEFLFDGSLILTNSFCAKATLCWYSQIYMCSSYYSKSTSTQRELSQLNF